MPEDVNVNDVPNGPLPNGDKLVEIADNDSPFVDEVSFTPGANAPTDRNPQVLEPVDKVSNIQFGCLI